jgi:hypothetical protein
MELKKPKKQKQLTQGMILPPKLDWQKEMKVFKINSTKSSISPLFRKCFLLGQSRTLGKHKICFLPKSSVLTL